MDLRECEAMTSHEAMAWKANVGIAARLLRRVLFEGYQRRAWEALGYEHWTECLKAIADEHEFSESYLWKLHAANQTEQLLDHGPVGQIPERQLRPLTSLPVEHREIAWQRAVETAPEGRVTERHVRQTIHEMFPDPEEDETDEDEEPEDEWDDRISEVLIPALGLLELDPSRVSNWSFDYRETCLERLDRAIEALMKTRKAIAAPVSPSLIHGRN